MHAAVVLFIASLFDLPAPAATVRLRVLGENGRPAPARIEFRGETAMPQCADATPNAPKPWSPGRPYYLGGFVMAGDCTLEAPPGRYTLIVERGLEFESVTQSVLLDQQPSEQTVQPRRWVDLRKSGWWSADFHVHREPRDLPLLVRAEDLNLAVQFTIWNRRSYWSDGRKPPPDGMERATPEHIVSLMNAEDERRGGAWMMHALPAPVDIAVPDGWYPPGLTFLRRALAARKGVLPWFDSEKPIWWETPVMVALATPDSMGIAHNHFHLRGGLDSEAWGRKRDVGKYPGLDGLMRYTFELYYRYLNLGFRMAPSAGAASGVMPSPPGYNRVYVKLDGAFNAENWYRALKNGPSFVTNGPALFARLNRGVLHVEARSRDPIDRVEAVANGKVIGTKAAPPGATELKAEFAVPVGHSWVAARCFAINKETPRFAHSNPIRLPGRWDAREDAEYFVQWMDELIGQSEADAKRFASPAEREELLGLYREARKIYEGKTR